MSTLMEDDIIGTPLVMRALDRENTNHANAYVKAKSGRVSLGNQQTDTQLPGSSA